MRDLVHDAVLRVRVLVLGLQVLLDQLEGRIDLRVQLLVVLA